jgi:cytoskeletal protein RodZ
MSLELDRTDPHFADPGKLPGERKRWILPFILAISILIALLIGGVWWQCGRGNIQIENLKTENASLKTKIARLETENAGLKTDKTSLETDKTNLAVENVRQAGQIGTLTRNYSSDLEQIVTTLTGYKAAREQDGKDTESERGQVLKAPGSWKERELVIKGIQDRQSRWRQEITGIEGRIRELNGRRTTITSRSSSSPTPAGSPN